MKVEPAIPRLLFFANSGRDSTDGRRVREFRRRLKCAEDSDVLYRDDFGRLRSIYALLKTARHLRPQLIYIELFAYSGLIGGILAKLFWGCKLAIGNGDDVFSTHWKAGRYARAALSGILDMVLRRYADLWVVWSPYYRRWLLKRGVRNVVCVPGCVDLDEMKLMSGVSLRAQLGLEGFLVVGVVGSLQYCRKLDMVFGWDLVEALSLLRDLPVKGLVVGDGTGLARLREMAKERCVEERVVFTGRVPHEALARYYAAIDVGLVTLSNDRDARFTWTAKLPEYLASNVFPIMTESEGSRRFVRRCGALLPFEGLKDKAYPARLARFLRLVLAGGDSLDRRWRGREIARSLLSFEVGARHLERGIRRALTPRRVPTGLAG
jgi:glycosyltransferase involved in cell wall biosynthesis